LSIFFFPLSLSLLQQEYVCCPKYFCCNKTIFLRAETVLSQAVLDCDHFFTAMTKIDNEFSLLSKRKLEFISEEESKK